MHGSLSLGGLGFDSCCYWWIREWHLAKTVFLHQKMPILGIVTLELWIA